MLNTFGLIVGNRGFFPDHLARSGREEMIRAIEKAGHKAVVLGTADSKHGAVETREEALKCAALFRAHASELDGVIVTLPNFGEERAIAEALRHADLPVPVLIQATPDSTGKMTIADRRDSFCGKMSACSNLKQYGIPYSLTTMHTEAPDSVLFASDLDWFAAVCRTVKGLRRLRVGAIGARPAAFNTVRYSEKILERNGISVEPIDLSEIFGRVEKLGDSDARTTAKLDEIRAYVRTEGI
ncbi:MAG TPA: fucose isomerase, partial [Bryobacteraceae bacterium]|nr:fucose isomerase [Bryobacteraceae bacterium]